jgi:protein O-GlcNAc transferase
MTNRAAEAAALFQKALGDEQAGKLALAEAGYRRLLTVMPNHAPAWHRLGLLGRRAGRSDLALAYLERASALEPAKPDYLADLAGTLAALGRLDEAETRFRDAIRRAPRHADAHNGLGNLLVKRGLLEEAVSSYRDAARLKPAVPGPRLNLAQTLLRLGRADEAAPEAAKAVSLQPALPAAQLLLGVVRSAQRRLTEAEACYRTALLLDPQLADAHRNLGDVAANLNRHDEAVACYQQALLLKPDVTSTWNNLGLALNYLGRAEEAQRCYAEALRRAPDQPGLRLNAAMAGLRVIYRDDAEIAVVRAEYEAALAAVHRVIDDPAVLIADAGAIGDKTPFLLAYHGRDDRALQERYGAGITKIMARLHPEWLRAPEVAPPQPGEKIRVGVLSAYFSTHSNWKIPIRGWLAGLDRDRFEPFGYSLGAVDDEATEEARRLCSRFRERLPTLARWAETIRADRLHVLLIPGIGMDALTTGLAALKLAPVQATSWGHPDTTGLPSIDHYLSSDLMEPADAQCYYTETLVRLPNLSIWYEPPTPATPTGLTRAELGVPDGAVLYWCCQSLFKYLPAYDFVFPAVAARLPQAVFLFINYSPGATVTDLFRARLDAAFAARGLAAARHCRFVAPMMPRRFAEITRLADIFLDSIGWSGCNSTLEALAENVPVVTLPGTFMRARHSAAILTRIGLTELIAEDAEGFVKLAVALGADPARRQALSRRIAAAKHLLYRDQAAIDGLAAYLEAAARGIHAA